MLSNGIALNFLRYLEVDVMHIEMPLIYEQISGLLQAILSGSRASEAGSSSQKKVTFQELGPVQPKTSTATRTTEDPNTERRHLRSTTTPKAQAQTHRIVGTPQAQSGAKTRGSGAGRWFYSVQPAVADYKAVIITAEHKLSTYIVAPLRSRHADGMYYGVIHTIGVSSEAAPRYKC